MDFTLTEEQIMIRDAARDFARNELLPGVIERDEKQEFPHEQIKKMGELGFLGMMTDPEYGGDYRAGTSGEMGWQRLSEWTERQRHPYLWAHHCTGRCV